MSVDTILTLITITYFAGALLATAIVDDNEAEYMYALLIVFFWPVTIIVLAGKVVVDWLGT